MGAGTADAHCGTAASSACAQRLRRSADVRATFATRAASGSRLLVVHARRRSDGGAPRATVVAGRTVGNAVARNRAKRRLRAALALTPLPASHDLVVVARAATVAAPFPALRHDLERAVTAVVRRT